MLCALLFHSLLLLFGQTHPVGTIIYSPVVTDADSGTNRAISFQLESPVSAPHQLCYPIVAVTVLWSPTHSELFVFLLQTNGPFVVNQLTGVISLASVLDYDVALSYVLSIRAQVLQ